MADSDGLSVSERLAWAARKGGSQAGGKNAAPTPSRGRKAASSGPSDPFVRAEAEDDDGYDPYSDRPPAPERLFERSPWD